MRFQFRKLAGAAGRGALAIALTAGAGAVASLAVVGPAEAKSAASGNSQAFIAASQPLQKTFKDSDPLLKRYIEAPAAEKDAAMAALRAAYANAPQELAAAEAAISTPQDRLVAGQWGQKVGTVLGDAAIIQRSLQNQVDSGLVPAADLPPIQYKLGALAYQNKDYATAARLLTPLVAANYSDDIAAEIVADSLTKQGKPAEALAALKQAVDARKAAGGAVPDSWIARANRIALEAKLGPQGSDWAIMLVANNPSPTNWRGSGQLVRSYNNYASAEALDISRLMFRAGGLNGKGRDVQSEYVEYIQAADARRFPGEVLKVIDAGVSSGNLSPTDTFVSEARSTANQRVGPDRASMPGLERDAHAPNAPVATVMGAADLFLSYDDPAKAEALYAIALAKPGVDAGRALTRMGIAQVDQGKYAEAQATFAKITGPRKPLADLWLVYVRQKASGGASPATSH